LALEIFSEESSRGKDSYQDQQEGIEKKRSHALPHSSKLPGLPQPEEARARFHQELNFNTPAPVSKSSRALALSRPWPVSIRTILFFRIQIAACPKCPKSSGTSP